MPPPSFGELRAESFQVTPHRIPLMLCLPTHTLTEHYIAVPVHIAQLKHTIMRRPLAAYKDVRSLDEFGDLILRIEHHQVRGASASGHEQEASVSVCSTISDEHAAWAEAFEAPVCMPVAYWNAHGGQQVDERDDAGEDFVRVREDGAPEEREGGGGYDQVFSR